MILKNLFIVFVGNPDRGRRLEREVETYGWRVSVASTVKMALAKYVFFLPDIVILDEFPESNLARSVAFI
jgi:DNA-binding response OmpR family regulator